MFSKKIIIKLFKIAPENFQTHTWHLLQFVSNCFSRHTWKFHNKLNHGKMFYFFFQLAMNQMITFDTSLDPEKKTLPDRAWGATCVHLKRGGWLSLAIEDGARRENLWLFCSAWKAISLVFLFIEIG
jgi:hypothetical protein